MFEEMSWRGCTVRWTFVVFRSKRTESIVLHLVYREYNSVFIYL